MPDLNDSLDRLEMLTDLMRQHESAIAVISAHRADVILDLREREAPVPFRVLADHMGVCEQAVFATLNKHHSGRVRVAR